MPNVLVHTLFADRVLAHWRMPGRHAPFELEDPRCQAAFLHGALGPDLGYFPGGDMFLAELTHRLRTGRMAHRLLTLATHPVQAAFVWGWVTHLLADARLHPHVDAHGEHIAEREQKTASAGVLSLARHSAVELAHVRIEVGLDGVFLAREPALGRRLPPAFALHELRFLARAYSDIYGPVVTARQLYSAHLSVARWHAVLIPLLRWMTADWSGEPVPGATVVGPLLRAGRGGWVRYLGAGPVAAAFVSPLRPPQRLLDTVASELESFPERVERIREGGVLLEDVDLEDSRPIDESTPKPATAGTLSELRARNLANAGRAYPASEQIAPGVLRRHAQSETPRKPTTKDTVMSAIRSTP